MRRGRKPACPRASDWGAGGHPGEDWRVRRSIRLSPSCCEEYDFTAQGTPLRAHLSGSYRSDRHGASSLRVTSLKLANLRAIESAEFRFKPGFNLIVGVNGVGKTSALDALSVCLSAVVKRANNLRSRVEAFSVEDIRIGADAMTVDCDVEIGGQAHSCLLHRPRETSVGSEGKAGMPREQSRRTPAVAGFIDPPSPVSGDEPDGRPLAVSFSTKRAVPWERAPGKGVASGGVAAAFADAFVDRELRLGEFGAWLRGQESIRKERPASSRVLSACEDAVTRFLPGYANLRLGGEDKSQILIDRDSVTVPVQRLSDGERGMLSLVLDLTRRLAQATRTWSTRPLKRKRSS